MRTSVRRARPPQAAPHARRAPTGPPTAGEPRGGAAGRRAGGGTRGEPLLQAWHDLTHAPSYVCSCRLTYRDQEWASQAQCSTRCDTCDLCADTPNCSGTLGCANCTTSQDAQGLDFVYPRLKTVSTGGNIGDAEVCISDLCIAGLSGEIGYWQLFRCARWMGRRGGGGGKHAASRGAGQVPQLRPPCCRPRVGAAPACRRTAQQRLLALMTLRRCSAACPCRAVTRPCARPSLPWTPTPTLGSSGSLKSINARRPRGAPHGELPGVSWPSARRRCSCSWGHRRRPASSHPPPARSLLVPPPPPHRPAAPRATTWPAIPWCPAPRCASAARAAPPTSAAPPAARPTGAPSPGWARASSSTARPSRVAPPAKTRPTWTCMHAVRVTAPPRCAASLETSTGQPSCSACSLALSAEAAAQRPCPLSLPSTPSAGLCRLHQRSAAQDLGLARL